MPNSTPPLFRHSLVSPEGPLSEELAFEREIKLVQAHRRNLIAQRNALFSPIALLSDATLARIFDFVEATEDDDWIEFDENNAWTDGSPMRNPRYLLPALLVSRQWRNIAMAQPTLWCFVDTTRWTPDGVRALVERSEGSSLYCVIREQVLPYGADGYNPEAVKKSLTWGSEKYLSLLLALFSRMRRLDLALMSKGFRSFARDRPETWEKLEYASFTAHRGDTGVEPEIPIASARNLRSLTVEGLRLDRKGVYSLPSLRSFCLKNTRTLRGVMKMALEELLNFLDCTPRLEILDVHAAWTANEEGESRRTITLPRLSKLSLELHEGVRSSLSGLWTHLSLVPGYSSQLCLMPDLHPSFLWDTTHLGREGQLAAIAETLSLSLPFEPAAVRPCGISLFMSHHYETGIGIAINADMRDESRETATGTASLQVKVSGFSRIGSSFGWTEPEEQLYAVEHLHRSRCVEVLLPRMCITSSLVTLECCIELLPSLWISAFGRSENLRNVLLYGETTASSFFHALGGTGDWSRDPQIHCVFPALQFIGVDSYERSRVALAYPIGGDGWQRNDGSPMIAHRPKWTQSVLPTLVTRLEERYARSQNTPLAKLAIHRETSESGCSLTCDTLLELLLLGRISHSGSNAVLEEILEAPKCAE